MLSSAISCLVKVALLVLFTALGVRVNHMLCTFFMKSIIAGTKISATCSSSNPDTNIDVSSTNSLEFASVCVCIC